MTPVSESNASESSVNALTRVSSAQITSLGPALRTHARFLRTRFKHKAQESARKVSVKLIFPVFFLIFPAVLLVTLGPAVLQLYSQLKTLTDAVP